MNVRAADLREYLVEKRYTGYHSLFKPVSKFRFIYIATADAFVPLRRGNTLRMYMKEQQEAQRVSRNNFNLGSIFLQKTPMTGHVNQVFHVGYQEDESHPIPSHPI